MSKPFSHTKFYKELESKLPNCTGSQRAQWVQEILVNEVDLRSLFNLLHCEKKIASRFLWLLSEIGEAKPSKLFIHLPHLLELSDEISHINFKESFAAYWLIAGVPEENEAKAIQFLFDWLLSNKINVTTKGRSMKVLTVLVKKHPDLKKEFILCLQDQISKHSKAFEKKVQKVLANLAKEKSNFYPHIEITKQ